VTPFAVERAASRAAGERTLPRGLVERAADAQRVARFVRERRAFVVRPDDLFISSYPRSGTTWLQHIAHMLRSDGDLDFAHITQVAPWFERELSLGRKRAADFERLQSPRIFKSHLPRMWLPDGARYLYVVRDGRDVAVSYYHFYRSHLGYEGDFEQFFRRFLQGELQYGSWFKHIAGWRKRAHAHGVLWIEYEALLADLVGQMRVIADFAGRAPAGRRLHELARACDFEFMRRHESRFDHASGEPGAASAASGAFVRSGRSGSFEHELSAAQRARFAAQQARPLWLPDLELRLPAFLH
jgi:hypothetical protein